MIQKLKKIGFSLILLLVALSNSIAQSTYNSSDYAAVGDVFYLTTANNYTLNYNTTGTNFNWDFTSLAGISQKELQFRNPNSTGYSVAIFPFIYNLRGANNTNLSSTDGTSASLTVGQTTIGIQDLNYYYKKSNTELTEVASADRINYNGTLIPVPNIYTTADKIYTFPISYGKTDSSNSTYRVNIPGFYYQEKTLSRTNVVDGWGSIKTPYGNFTNALRMTTTLVQNDSISIGSQGLPRVIRTSRELKWFDASKKYPILIVTQSFAANVWATTKIEYLDTKKDFETTALFAYTPTIPNAVEDVNFQNLSINATTYSWNFGDPSSSNNTSTAQHPTHAYSANGTYNVTLTSSNATYTDSVTIQVVVTDVPAALFTYTPRPPVTGQNVEFQNLSINATTYSWNFGDPTNTTNTSTERNPTHIFNTNGTYTVTLIAGNGTSDSTFVSYLTVSDVPVAAFAYTPLIPVAGDTVNFQNLSLNATSYSWNFDDPTSGTSNTSTDKNPSHLFSTSDAYFVKLTSTNTTTSKSITLIVLVTENTLVIGMNIKNDKINIYPNPFSNYISISEENNHSEYELSNLEGKTVYKANHIQNNFSNLSKGIYLLKVTDNNKTATYKLVKN